MNRLLLFIVMLLHPFSWAPAAPAAENYLARLQKTITQTQSNLATLAESADRAAHEFLSGGNLWVAGRQADFTSVSQCRLMNPWPGKSAVVKEVGRTEAVPVKLVKSNGECLVFSTLAGRKYSVEPSKEQSL